MKKEKRKPLTKEEEIEIIELYNNGVDTSFLAQKFNYGFGNRHGILNCLKRNNITIRPDNLTHSTKYDIDTTYFEKVDTINKAYFLGLLYADGYNGISNNVIRLQLSDPDQEILEKLKVELKTKKPLRFYNRQKKNPNWKNSYALDIENKKMCLDLEKLGCGQAKTHNIDYPHFLPDKYHSHFIRGVFDGDGCITYSSNKKDMYISFTGNRLLLEGIQNVLINTLGFSRTKFSKRFKNRNDEIYSLIYGGNIQIKKFKEWLYKDTELFLQRKFNKFL